MPSITLRDITRDNWRATLALTVHPEQQHFIADYTPIAAIALAEVMARRRFSRDAKYCVSTDHIASLQIIMHPQQPIQRRTQLLRRRADLLGQRRVAMVA